VTSIASALGPVFLLILFGALLRRLNFPGDGFWPQAERLTYYVLFPAMLIHRLGNAEMGDTPLLAILASIVFMLLAGSLLLYLSRGLITRDGAAFTSVYQGGIRFNTYIGMACVDALYGDAGLVVAAVTVAIMIPLVNLLCVLAFHLTLHRGKLSPASILRSVLGNPLILACLIGIALNQTGIGLPGWSEPTLALLGAAALPVGLLAVGVGLQISAIGSAWREIASASVWRFAAMPLLLILAMSWWPVPQLDATVMMLFAVLPTATSAFILSRQLGGDTVLMANTITVQTLLGFVVIPAWLMLAPRLL
jgi:predicted permease